MGRLSSSTTPLQVIEKRTLVLSVFRPMEGACTVQSAWLVRANTASSGYHPWFVHSYTLLDPPPSKEAHYTSLFFKPNSSPTSKNRQLLLTLLPYLPEPVPFTPLLAKLREDIHASLARGQLTMLGEVGLDGGARVRWPTAARHLYTEKYGTDAEGGADPDADDGGAGGNDDGAGAGVRPRVKVDEQGEWKRLTPFKTSMAHQREIAKRQMEIAVECAVNVSFHSVAAAGECGGFAYSWIHLFPLPSRK